VEDDAAYSDGLAKLRERLRDLRGRAGLTRDQLRARTGLGHTTISQAFNDGPTCPTWTTVAKLAQALGVDPAGMDELQKLWQLAQPPAPSVGRRTDQVRGKTDVRTDEPCIADVGPQALEVHRAVLAAPDSGGYPFLTPYMPRAHDDELRAYLTPALAGGESVLLMLTGDSATGKTRALYEALGNLAPQHRLLRPSSTGELLRFVLEGHFEPRTVLWLNEAQRFFYGRGAEQAAAELRRLLVSTPGLTAVGTLWTDPYWEELTRPGRAGDPHGQVRGLLDCAACRRVMVPDHFSAAELRTWGTVARTAEAGGDRRPADALRAGVADGRVVQHLSGGPALLAAYRCGPGSHFSHVEHAVLTAALDARHLGHRGPLPAGLLADAADGALHPRRRPDGAAWADAVLKALSTGERDDGRRTDIRHTLTAMHTPLTRSGSDAVYEPADYLVQHVRGESPDRPAKPSLWRALLDHTTDADDLMSLGWSALHHGHLRQTARLWHKAVVVGHPACAYALADLLDDDTDPQGKGRLWAAGHAPLYDPDGVRLLLDVLRGDGQPAAVDALMRREPEIHVDCDDAEAVAYLLERLRTAGLQDAAVMLAARAVETSDATDVGPGTDLLVSLRTLGLDDAYRVLAARAAREVDATDVAFLPFLLAELNTHSPVHAAVLAARAAAEIDISDANNVATLLDALRQQDLRDAITALLGRAPEAHAGLDDPEAVSLLIQALEELGQTEAVHALLARDPGAFADVSDPDAVSWLLRTLLVYDRSAQALAVAARAAGETDILHPSPVAELLEFLHELGMGTEVATLLDRGVVAHADVDDSEGIGELLVALHRLEEGKALASLACRAASETDVSDPDAVDVLLVRLEEVGQEEAVRKLLTRVPDLEEDDEVPPPEEPALPWGIDLDGSPAGRWTWDDMNLS
jgi:transcriptional regulator with XRE-family HTH domain